MSAEVVYADSSALVKYLTDEEGSASLRSYVVDLHDRGHHLVSSALAEVEVARALLRVGISSPDLRSVGILAISDHVRVAAGSMEPPSLRSLDAIHLATAAGLGLALRAVCTYDHRMAEAARAAGMDVVAP